MQELEKLRKDYPVGCKVKLIEMDDIQAPAVGTMGVVNHIVDIGSLHVMWSNGSSLAVCYGIDKCRRID